MGWTKRSYDVLHNWPDVSKRPHVKRVLRADGLDNVVAVLESAKHLGVWYQITREAAEAVGVDIIEQSAVEAEAELSAAAAALGRKGGSVRSEAKTKAVRENAKLGGWPKGRPRKSRE